MWKYFDNTSAFNSSLNNQNNNNCHVDTNVMRALCGEGNANSSLKGRILTTKYGNSEYDYYNYHDGEDSNYNSFERLHEQTRKNLYKRKKRKTLLSSIGKTLKKYDKRYEDKVMSAFYIDDRRNNDNVYNLQFIVSKVAQISTPVLLSIMYAFISFCLFTSTFIRIFLPFLVFIASILYTVKKFVKCYVKAIRKEKIYNSKGKIQMKYDY
ncbi:hypothetical protein PMALA_069260 [Plasmodium malariae]|nr:hypothetical protein PMALA_069260 [Plasmodium malariae]